MAEKYHWTPQQVGSLTMYQALVYSGFWAPEDIWQKQDIK